MVFANCIILLLWEVEHSITKDSLTALYFDYCYGQLFTTQWWRNPDAAKRMFYLPHKSIWNSCLKNILILRYRTRDCISTDIKEKCFTGSRSRITWCSLSFTTVKCIVLDLKIIIHKSLIWNYTLIVILSSDEKVL